MTDVADRPRPKSRSRTSPVSPKQGKTGRAGRKRAAPRGAGTGAQSISEKLLDWYDRERRELPWRFAPGVEADPYAVWLSEVMLQQTTVKAVAPYFAAFLKRWPRVEDLASASEDDVLRAWAGLGYYSRARNLHKCAQLVAADFGGAFPQTEADLRKLPGVGPYTAAAIAAIAFDEPTTPVDGNIERVTARLFKIETPLPSAKPELKAAAQVLTPSKRPGDFAQAMMDLGATVCTPKRPSCLMCPLQADCRAFKSGCAESLPRRKQKPERPIRRGAAFVAIADDGTVLLRQRPSDGLLARMMEVPGTEWIEARSAGAKARSGDVGHHALKQVPVQGDWWQLSGDVVHTFTHFRLELTIYRALVARGTPLTIWADGQRCRWVARSQLDGEALPSVMKKAIAHALKTL